MWFEVQDMLASGLVVGKLSMAVAYARPAIPKDRTVPLIEGPAVTGRRMRGTSRREKATRARAALIELFGQFDECHLISLIGRDDRRRRVSRQLASLDVDLGYLGVRLFEGLSYDEADGFPSKGVRGCFNSHLALMRRCADRGRPMLVMEDDVFFHLDRLAQWGTALGGIVDQPWDLACIGYLNRVGSGHEAQLERVSGNTIGGHFYAVRPEFAGAMATFMEAARYRPAGSLEGGRMYRDGAFNFYRARNPGWLTMAPGQSLASQGGSRSDLTPRKRDRLPVARQCIGTVRRLRETLA